MCQIQEKHLKIKQKKTSAAKLHETSGQTWIIEICININIMQEENQSDLQKTIKEKEIVKTSSSF